MASSVGRRKEITSAGLDVLLSCTLADAIIDGQQVTNIPLLQFKHGTQRTFLLNLKHACHIGAGRAFDGVLVRQFGEVHPCME
jgi:hypothetical protein